MSITVDSSRLSLVREESTYLAICTSQGDRTVYTTRIPLSDLSVILTIPDPAKPDPDNRKDAEITEEDVDNYDPSLSEKKKNEPPAPPTKAMRLRESSLLGSVGMLRVLGGVYRNLREAGAEDGDIQEFFKRLDRHMTAPVTEDSIWRTTDANEDFEPNASAPIMRQQNVVHLTKVITDWYRKAPAGI